MDSQTRFYIATLGCKVNQYESQAIREAWEDQGCVETRDPYQANLVLINSCAVTDRAMRDLRRMARRLHRESPDARLVIAGCAVQAAREEMAGIPGMAELIPQSEKAGLKNLVKGISDPARQSEQSGFPDYSIKDYKRARAVLKVQDGCSHRCTYCIVPKARGPAGSRRPEDVLEEARRLIGAGFREIILSGINLRQYGEDLEEAETCQDFWDLVLLLERELASDWAGKARLRLSSLDPGQLTEKGLTVLRQSRMVCPHLHLSLQSLSPEVLRRMGRGHYRFREIYDFLMELKGVWPIFGLGADLLTGFPGETAEDFQKTRDSLEKLPLSYAHVFPYSSRPGTPAAKYANQVSQSEKKARAKILRETVFEKKQAFMSKLLDLEELKIIAEGEDPVRGVCEYYAPCRFKKGACAGVREMLAAKPVGAGRDFMEVE
ncbi:MAG: MiaB/RimO family radical SAM methylthiotransferase [Thermodesulfobacteriota bacterium]|nr:MiaB/RimO family radical SAM methylthiotransferase [Thermodesulfobacteriota bacterium]